VAAGTPAVSIFGKTWLLHVTHVLGTTAENNLAMIADSVSFLKKNGKEVIFDAEHFFDGFRADRDYALAAVRAAADAGADWLALCDTNGGSLPSFIAEAIRELKKVTKTAIGIHTHNDGDMAVANAWPRSRPAPPWCKARSTAGANAVATPTSSRSSRPCSSRWGTPACPRGNLKRLTELSRTASELANIRPRAHAPYVGTSAFAHKGGAHVAAVEKLAASYEHVTPESVGNQRKVVVSELSGRGNVRMVARDLGMDMRGYEPALLARVKELENQGYQFEAAEGSFELMVRRAQPGYAEPFEVLDVVVLSERRAARDVRGGHGQAEGGRRDLARGRRGRRPGGCHGSRLSQGARPALPAAARGPPDRLQGAHPRSRGRHRGQDPRAHRVANARGKLEHHRRVAKHDRGQLRGPARRPGAAADSRGQAMLSGFYRTHFDTWHVRAGLGITAPLAHQPLEMDGRLYAFLFNQTMAMNGMWNLWLWTPDRMAVPVSARADYSLAGGYVLAAEGAIAPVIGVRNGATGTDVLGQLALEARLPLGTRFELCPRLQTVLLPKTSVDRLQSAFELRGAVKTEHGRYFAGVLFNLDQPLGIFSGLNRWGFHLGKEIDL
jgi:hypothetical protein